MRVPCRFCKSPVNEAVRDLHEENCSARYQAPTGKAVAPAPVSDHLAEAARMSDATLPSFREHVRSLLPAPVVPAPVEQPAQGLTDEELHKATQWSILKARGDLSDIGYPELVRLLKRATPEQVDRINSALAESEPAALIAPVQPVAQVLAPLQGNGLYYPKANPYFVVPQDLALKLERLKIQRGRHPVNVLLIGPQGSGKTSLALQFAAQTGSPCYIAPCVTMQEPAQWWGMQGISPEKGTFYIPSQFVRACETPGCVVILDDMNRVENPKVLNPLFPLLDDRRETPLDELGRVVRVAERVVFFGTVNIGFAFQGTDPIDLALRDRFDQIEVIYPDGPQIQEIMLHRTQVPSDKATLLAAFAFTLANHPVEDNRIFISMRQMIRIAEEVADGATIRDAVTFTMLSSCRDDQMEQVTQTLQQLLGEDYKAQKRTWVTW